MSNQSLLSDFPKTSDFDLTLFFYPSPGLNWSTPRSLLWSMIKNKTIFKRPRAIGHVSVMIRTPYDFIFTGMTQSDPNEGRKEVLKQGFGMGILLHSFGGALETPEKLLPEIASRKDKANLLSFVRFEINQQTSDRIKLFLNEYEKRGGGRVYGMRPRPRYAEGGGCGPFAATVLEIAGLLDEDMKASWQRRFRVPEHLMGGPLKGRKVTPFKLFRQKSWAAEHEDYEEAHFWDPDLMHAWMLKHHEHPKSRREKWGKALGIVFDFKNNEPPTDAVIKKDPLPS